MRVFKKSKVSGIVTALIAFTVLGYVAIVIRWHPNFYNNVVKEARGALHLSGSAHELREPRKIWSEVSITEKEIHRMDDDERRLVYERYPQSVGGHYVSYSNRYGNTKTYGSVYVYDRNSSNCLVTVTFQLAHTFG
jgi:hypothetical protein